ncbi:hypothetical protein QR680_005552 [Steinernema hermaphroditum]|uniref:Uncharacterized protein n=1 Tax=Steinernema hermaphroditum TaxID=289476 RepID=A0AA39HSG1_9BILA|nr:hypothetical protein QR680_005552 [Steinernema hermaphroditum]
MTLPDFDKVHVKVERGKRPRLRIDDDSRFVQVTIPADLNQNWPSLTGNLVGGISVEVKKLEQQYKVSVNHLHSRKPEFSIFIAALNRDHELKTVVRDLNTRLTYVAIGGPNMQVSGHLKADRLTLESTLGPLNINAKVVASKVSLNAQQLFVCPEASIACQMIKASEIRRGRIDGKIFPSEEATQEMRATFDASLVHIGIDGTIGSLKGRDSRPSTVPSQRPSTPSPPEATVDDLFVNISGCLANYGKIVAKRLLELNVGGTLLTLEDGRIDSASRGFSAYRQINGIGGRSSDDVSPTSSRLSSAIDLQSPRTVAELLEQGVDKNDASERSNCPSVTPKRFALRRYKEISSVAQRNSQRQKISQISALLTIHDWRRGVIAAPSVVSSVARDCQDCAQFKAEQLALRVGHSAWCEADSIWSSGSVEMHVGRDVVFEGQVKHLGLRLECLGGVETHGEAIVSQETSAIVVAQKFLCDGIWTVARSLALETAELLQMTSNSYLETGVLRVVSGRDVELNGTWQTGALEAEAGGDLKTLSNGKCLVEGGACVRANRFTSGGLWKVTDALDLKVTASADFLQFSVTEANLCKLVVLHNCTLGGTWMLGNLLAYVRNELYTTPFGRCNLDVAGTVAIGAFQNHGQWQSEQNLHLFAGSVEQSPRALLFIKDTFELSVLSNSLGGWHGRVVAHSLVLKALKRLRLHGSVRVNELEVSTPYASESQFVCSGQIDVLVGPLMLKGNSAFDEELPKEDFAPHPFPAFVLDGVLRAQAIVGPFLAVAVTSQGSASLTSLPSLLPEAPFHILLSVGALHTEKFSVVESISGTDVHAEGVVCATRFVHEGQLRFGADEVSVFADEMRNEGRLTATVKKAHNHMRAAVLQIQQLLLNNAVISADRLSIFGEGRLVNRNRIFAVEHLHIRLANFFNDDGELESKESLRLLSSSTTEWSRVGGAISAPHKKVAIGGERLCLAAKNLHKLVDEKNFISAKKDLRIATEMLDESMTRVLGFSARDSIHFEAPVRMEAVEIQIGELDDLSTVVVESGLCAHRVFVTGHCRSLRLVLNGVLDCRKLVFKESIREVLVSGNGSLECVDELQVDGVRIEFALLNVSVGEIRAKTVRISRNSNVRLTNPAVSLVADSLRCEGNLLFDGKMTVTPFGTPSRITVSGTLIGTGVGSELSLEADSVSLDGQVANVAFVEVFVRDRLDVEPPFVAKNVAGFAVESQHDCTLDGIFSGCQSLFVNADALVVAGTFEDVENISFFAAQKVYFNAAVQRSQKLTLNSKGPVYTRGSVKATTVVEFECKWLHMNCAVEEVTSTTVSAWSSVLQAPLRSSALRIRGLGVCLVSGDLRVDECDVVVPFFIAVDGNVFSVSRMNIRSLVSIVRRLEDCEALRNLSSLSFVFDFPDSEQKILTRREMESWKATCRQLKESFVSSATLRPDEILIGVKYLGEVDPVVVRLPICALLENLKRLVAKFHTQQISGFNCSKLIDALQKSQNAFLSSNEDEISVEKSKKKGKKRRSGSEEADCGQETLFEVIASFKNAFEKQRRPSKSSTDSTDVGYASRSSSEDLEGAARSASPEADKDLSLKLERLEEEEETELTFRKTLEECETEYKARCTASPETPTFEIECIYHSETETDSAESEIDEETALNFVISHGARIAVLPIDFDKFRGATSPPSPLLPVRTPSRHDLAMKRLQVKQNLSTFDLKSYSSQTSLDSVDTTLGDMGTPMRFAPSPLRRSLIPRLSSRGSHSLLNRILDNRA